MPCIKCRRPETAYTFRVLEVQTLHIRDLDGEKRVQALGGFRKFSVCADCARAQLSKARGFWGNLREKGAPYGIVLLLGIAVTAIWNPAAAQLRLVGWAAVACGGIGAAAAVQKAILQKRRACELPQAEAAEQSAWECVLRAAPKKYGENDLEYIPIDEKTCSAKEADLMLRYDLLPAIAEKAYRMLHEIPEKEEAGTAK